MTNVKHYTQGKFEVIDIIQTCTQDLPAFEGYCLGNIIKYVLRAEYKEQYLEDIAKARDYAFMLCKGEWCNEFVPPKRSYDVCEYVTMGLPVYECIHLKRGLQYVMECDSYEKAAQANAEFMRVARYNAHHVNTLLMSLRSE